MSVSKIARKWMVRIQSLARQKSVEKLEFVASGLCLKWTSAAEVRLPTYSLLLRSEEFGGLLWDKVHASETVRVSLSNRA